MSMRPPELGEAGKGGQADALRRFLNGIVSDWTANVFLIVFSNCSNVAE